MTTIQAIPITKVRTKRCTTCKADKPISEFGKNTAMKDGIHYRCKQCVSESAKKVLERYRNNKSKEIIMEKKCSGCKIIKLIKEFSRDRCTKDGFTTYCRKCESNISKKWQKKRMYMPKIIILKKRCIDCNIEKDIKYFWKDPRSLDGYHRYCNECFSKRKHISRMKHRDRIKKYNLKMRKLYKIMPEQVKKDRIRTKRWAEKFPEKRDVISLRYYSRKNNAQFGLKRGDKKAIFEMFSNECPFCGSRENLCLEHVIPVSRYDVFNPGTSMGNLMPLCRRCNSSKHDRLLNEYLLNEDLLHPRISAHLKERGITPWELYVEIKYVLSVMAKS